MGKELLHLVDRQTGLLNIGKYHHMVAKVVLMLLCVCFSA